MEDADADAPTTDPATLSVVNYLGIERNDLVSLPELLQKTRIDGFSFLVCPLAHPRYHRTEAQVLHRKEPWTRSDMVLQHDTWSTSIVGKVSPWLDCDSPLAPLAAQSCAILQQELAWAQHLGIYAVLVPLTGPRVCNLAAVLNRFVRSTTRVQVWVRVPLAQADADPWAWWHSLRALCDSHSLLGVVLDLPRGAASVLVGPLLGRWLSEAPKAVFVPRTAFRPRPGAPAVPPQLQLTPAAAAVICQLIRARTQLVLASCGSRPPAPFAAALQDLVAAAASQPADDLTRQTDRYTDVLQAPLQPLADHLESSTYEVFEQDPIKYRLYEQAVAAALRHLSAAAPQAAARFVLMVLGAGRGPILRAAIRAAKTVNLLHLCKFYALDKNPHAIVTLRNLKLSQGWRDEQVEVVHADMREWTPPERADVVISELLGSFGDNELSPECLDVLPRVLSARGVSIPQAYESFLEPLQAPRLHADVRAHGDLAHLETPYVVKLGLVYRPGREPPQRCFRFEHLNPGQAGSPDHRRHTRLQWHMGPQASLVHGFAGYFDSQLFGDVRMSIVPSTHSEGMISWFPIFFPLQQPLLVPGDSLLVADFWRCCSARKVWYEWAVTGPWPLSTPIHNPLGRSSFIGL